MTARRPAATLVVKFADNSTFRLTTAIGNWNRAAAVARAGWQSRHRTTSEPPAITEMHFEDNGLVLTCRPESPTVPDVGHGSRKKSAPPAEMTDAERAALLAAISRMQFVFAKTLWKEPHQWVNRLQNAEEDYVLLWTYWKNFGVYGTWDSPTGPRRYKYLYPGDGFKYWAMSTVLYPKESPLATRIINRTREENPEEYFAEDMKRAKAEMEAKAAHRHKP